LKHICVFQLCSTWFRIYFTDGKFVKNYKQMIAEWNEDAKIVTLCVSYYYNILKIRNELTFTDGGVQANSYGNS